MMNETQTVFSLFFAIFWGAVANVQPRWKTFHWANLHFSQARCRLFYSILILNVLPIIFYAVFLFFLAGSKVCVWTLTATVSVTIGGVLPAFAIFGFNRLWLGIMESKVDKFYLKDAMGKYMTEDNVTLDTQPIAEAGKGNILTGIGYLIFSIGAVIIHWLIVN